MKRIVDASGEPEIESLWADDQPVEVAVQRQECTVKVDIEVRESDKVYLWEDRG